MNLITILIVAAIVTGFTFLFEILKELVLYIFNKCFRKKYFVSYVTQKGHHPAMFQNCVIDVPPVSWQIEQNKNSNGIRYRVIFWQSASKNEAQPFIKTWTNPS